MSDSVPINGRNGGKTENASFDMDSIRIWSIILAGGNGERMAELTHRWMGRSIPKQYCAFVGRRSMLEHTLLRADNWSACERQLVIVAAAHRNEALPLLAGRRSRKVILQPANRDTLPGIFLPLTHVVARDSKATVLIFPSDHFIYPERKFVPVVNHAVQAVEELSDRIVIVGAPADSQELEYGWVCPGDAIWTSKEHSIRSVKRFLEKPSAPLASQAMACGGLWNTFIMAAKAETLWQLGWDYAPEVLKHFERLAEAIGTSREQETIEAIYEIMPARNFSYSLLTPAASRIGVISMEGVTWSDWGREERIVQTLARIGKVPNFPVMLASGKGTAGPAANDSLQESHNVRISA
jgi:mannose-1-phosphate guanylyltransferase